MLDDGNGKGSDGKRVRAKDRRRMAEEEALRRDLREDLDSMLAKVDELSAARVTLSKGLSERASARYEVAISRVKALRKALADMPIVDLENVGKVLDDAKRRTSKKGVLEGDLRKKEALALDRIFVEVTENIDGIMDIEAAGALADLEGNLEKVFLVMNKRVAEVDATASKRLSVIRSSIRSLRRMTGKLDGNALGRTVKSVERLRTSLSEVDIRALRSRRKDLIGLDKELRHMEAVLTSLVERARRPKDGGEKGKGKGKGK